MKIGITAIGIGKAARPGTIRMVAEHAERLNIATLWAPEHVVLFDNPASKYPYTDDGRFLAGSTISLLDPFIGLTYAAAHTERLRLATGICLVPEHNPLVLAKVIASLDYLSGGRLALGVGIGWAAEEFAALLKGGVPSVEEIKQAHEMLNANKTPDQLHGVIGTMAAQIQSRIAALNAQAKNSLGPFANKVTIITPEGQAALDHLRERGLIGKFDLGEEGAAQPAQQPPQAQTGDFSHLWGG